jgi:hypothetical protein
MVLNIGRSLLIIVHDIGSLLLVDREKQSGLDRGPGLAATREGCTGDQCTASFIHLAVVTGSLIDVGKFAELLLPTAVIKLDYRTGY